MMLHPLYQLPAEDAPLGEWLRPLSATLTTRRTSYFSDDARSDNHGALVQKLRKIAKLPRKNEIDEAAVCKMRSQGIRVAVIAARLGVATASIYRALKRVSGAL